MNELIRLSPTGIEYGDYAWNCASGCGNNIDGRCAAGGFKCWAYSITQRFENHYPNGFKPTIYPEALLSPLYLKKPSRILCAFMGDLFWSCPEFNPDRRDILQGFTEDGSSWADLSLKRIIYYVIESCPQHTFIFLTKQPQNLIKFGPFPDNCWVGITCTSAAIFNQYLLTLQDIKATVKFISFEPLLEWDWNNTYQTPLELILKELGVNWVIIGAQTKPSVFPEFEWVVEIVTACDKAGIPVFLKDNLNCCSINDYPELLDKQGNMRQEMPK